MNSCTAIDSVGSPKPTETQGEPPLLSICIPTYNRQESLLALIKSLLTIAGDFEICVHVDGSTDGTLDALLAIEAPQLRVRAAPNRGRAAALLSALRLARGRFVMIFDDDDTIYKEGLQTVLADCATPLPAGAVGFVYHLEDQHQHQISAEFPVDQSNFLALRADHGIKGDTKEVVLTAALQRVLYDNAGGYRRVPTSLLWSRLALEFDVICRNTVIGRKVYLQGGMTANIRRLKLQNAYPMALLYLAHVMGFWRRRYRSLRFLGRALLGVARYSSRAALTAVLPSR